MKRILWRIKNNLPPARELSKKYAIDAVLAGILINRGISRDRFDSFLEPTLDYLHSPHLLPDIGKADKRIKEAAAKKEKVLVFGDYDVDGITSLAVFNEFAKKYPSIFSFYIPDRVSEGYGLNKPAIAEAKKNKVKLIIAFDCGTNSLSEIEYAKSLGIDIIVVDHHLPPDKLPEPVAFINPKRRDSAYPFLDLSAAALAFKLLQVLEAGDCYQVLDLVALSLVCDVVPLLGENRILLKEGISRLRQSRRPAVESLCSLTKIKQNSIDVFHIGYILGPRINASGRIAHAKDALELFLSDDLEKVQAVARKLNKYNQLRKNIEKQILKEAEQKMKDTSCGEHAIVIGGRNWHPGVLGIVASRLKDKYCRPSFVVSLAKGRAKGSGRSIHSLHLMEAMQECSDSLIAYGGHRKAVGMELDVDKLDIFREDMNLFVQESLDSKDFLPVLEIDAEVGFEKITNDFIADLGRLYPYGEANPKPLFLAKGIKKKKGIQRIKSWYSAWLTDGRRVLEVILYNKDLAEIINYGKRFDIVFSPGKDNYYNRPRLFLRDCRLA